MSKPRIITGPFYFQRNATVAPRIETKLPGLFRSAQFNRAEINEEERTAPVVFATETPVDRWFGRERLVCTPQACNVQRANTLGAFLSEHDRQKQIGVIVKDSIKFAERVGRAVLRFSRNKPLAEEEWKDVLDGVRGLFSVGYIVHRLLLVEENDNLGDLYEAREWEILEISLVSIPADTNCTVDESREIDFIFPVRVSADESQPIQKQTSMLRHSKYFARFFHNAPGEGGGAGGGGGGNPAPPVTVPAGGVDPAATQRAVEEARTRETARIQELGALGARYNCMDEMVARMGKTGADGSVESALRYITDNGLQKKTTAPKNGPTPGGAQPLPPAGGEGGDGNRALSLSIGALMVREAAFKTEIADRKGSENRRFRFEVKDALSFRHAALSRATVTTGNIGAGVIVPQRLPGVIEQELERLTVADLFGSGVTNSNKIEFLKEVGYANAAATVAEGANKPEASFTLELAEVSVRKIAVMAKITDEMTQDFPYIITFVDGKLRFMVEEREELQLLFGDGVAPNILGIMNTPDVQTHAMGADSAADAIHKAITKCRVNGRAEPSGIVMHPNDWERIKLGKDANGQYYAGGPFYAPYGAGGYVAIERLWGLPTVVTTNMAEGSALTGAFKRHGFVFRATGITVESTNSNEDDFKKNLVSFRAEERLTLLVDRPAAFCIITGLNA